MRIQSINQARKTAIVGATGFFFTNKNAICRREYAFVLTDANARTGKRGEGGGESDSKVLGACGRDKLNENGKLLLGFAEDNKLALLNTLFCTPKSGVSYYVSKHQPQQGISTFGLYPDNAGGPPTHPLR